MESKAPGWYPDPDQLGRLRYFDGARWTDAVPGTTPLPRSAVPRRKRRRGPRPLVAVGLIVAIAGVVSGAGLYLNELYHHRSVAALLEGVEASEDAMQTWQASLEEFFEPCMGDAAGAVCRAWWDDPSTKDALSELATGTAAAIATATTELGATEYGPIASWHLDVLEARDAYLQHADAWASYLEEVAAVPETVLLDTPADDRIDPTFATACEALAALGTPTMAGLDGREHRRRIETVCAAPTAPVPDGLV